VTIPSTPTSATFPKKRLYKASAGGARPEERKAICVPGVAQFSWGALLSAGIDEDSQIRTAFIYPTCTLQARSPLVLYCRMFFVPGSAGRSRTRHPAQASVGQA